MSKLPAFQFYPADWRKSADIQAMDFYDRGVWFEILCLMHESEERGRLLFAKEPMSDEVLAKLLRISVKKLKKSVEIFLKFGVAFRDESGALCNRRMIRDEQIRRVRAESGKKGGNPILLNQTDNQNDKQNPTPSSSSSSSASTTSEGPVFVATILAGVRKELNINKLSLAQERDWSNHAVLALENEFTVGDFLECLSLLRKQKWRTSAVEPAHVTKNLSELPKLRQDAKQNGQGDRLQTAEEKLAADEEYRRTRTSSLPRLSESGPNDIQTLTGDRPA